MSNNKRKCVIHEISRFKRKERRSSSSDGKSFPQGKRIFEEDPNDTDKVLMTLDMSKDVAAKLQQVIDELGTMDKKIKSVMAKVASLKKTMHSI